MAHLIGLTGPAGSGKDAAAACVPGSVRVAFADPLYRGLAAMFRVGEAALRDRASKEQPLPGVGHSPRQLLQTLGLEWGRRHLGENVWVTLALREIVEARLRHPGATIVVPDVRFRNEAEMIRRLGGEVWLVYRPGVALVAAHASEDGIPLGLIDRLVVNDGGLARLAERVRGTAG